MKIASKTLLAALFMKLTLASTPIEVMIPVDHVYSPAGFDSNDNTQVVISGFLPNLCHKSPKAIVKRTGSKVDIKLLSLKYDITNPYCPEVIVPFVETVNLGVMDKGNYDVTVNGRSIYEQGSRMTVDEATSDAVDEHIYAGVEYIEKEMGSRTITLKGYNPSDCFELDEIVFKDNNKDTYSILPKMKQVAPLCTLKLVPFEYQVEVPKKLNADNVLLHVRSIEGRSVNTIFSNVLTR